jgi:hypothetical protein
MLAFDRTEGASGAGGSWSHVQAGGETGTRIYLKFDG